MKFNRTAIIVSLLVLAALLLILWVGGYFGRPASGQYDAFAQCLTDKGAVMYGANWCSHCQNEKRAFGDSFRHVSYVECTEEPAKCRAAGVEGYPTWLFPDGRRLVGEQGLQKLSSESGCLLTPAS